MDRPGRITLVTLAAELGVHPSTVSRALSSDPAVSGTVARRTAERIRRVAQEEGYTPNRIGSTLRTGRSRSLAVLVPHTSEYVVGSVYEGLDAAAAELGYATFVANTFDDERIRSMRIDRLMQWGVDSILYADAQMDSEDMEPVGGVQCWPIIRRGTRDHRYRADDELGGRLVARHLIEQGYDDAAVIAGPHDASTFVDRVRGFLDEYATLGGRVDPSLIVSSGLDIASGRITAGRIIPRLPDGAAVFAAHDPLALGTYVAARGLGLRIGTDLGVVGYNDVEFSSQLPVSLTSVRWDFRALGRAIAIDTIATVEGRGSQTEIPPPLLIARDSTCGPSAR